MDVANLPSLSKLYTRKQIDAMRDELIAKHGDKCALCDKPRSAFKNRFSLDHNHRTGKIRGLLCFSCNKFKVGRSSLESSKKVHEYLLQYDPEGG
jgi:hypothetical protein